MFRVTTAKRKSDNDMLEMSSALVDGKLLYDANSRTLITGAAAVSRLDSCCRRNSLVMGMKPLNKLDEAASRPAW